MPRQKSHLLGDKQISSVGIFAVVAFYTLFRVHLTLIIVYICPKRHLIVPFRVFYSQTGNTRKQVLLDVFWDKREATELNGRRIKQRNKPRRSFKSSSWKTAHDGVAGINQTPSELKAVASTSASLYDAVARLHQTPSRPTTKPQILEASLSDGVTAYKATPSRPVTL